MLFENERNLCFCQDFVSMHKEGWKEGNFKSLEVREASFSHLKIWQIATSSIILHIIQRLCSALAEAYCYDGVDVHIFLSKNFLQNGKIV